jgi:NAD(P)-dependent dehydrogenase (short-subunit alcohol dehydrogenase family)
MAEKTTQRHRGRGALLAAATAGAVFAARKLRRSTSAYDFTGRVVVITGGARGLGFAMARRWALEGARLAILGRDGADLERARQNLLEHATDVLAIPCDVRDQASVDAAIAHVIERYGAVDVLVNNAGILQAGPVEHMTLAEFRDTMDTHVWGSLYTMLAVIPHMRRQGEGRIVNITSVGGKVAVPHLVPYSTSKFAQVGLSDGMRYELAKDGIVVTTVCPGLMRTGSHMNAMYKGKHQTEFSLFSILLAQPFVSTNAPSAAQQIVDACRQGLPLLIITPQAQLLVALNTIAPGWLSAIMSLAVRVLPGPTDAGGDEIKTGWQSRTALAPSPLTYLADRGTDEFNGLKDHAPLTGDKVTR